MSYEYLASPYSHINPMVMAERYREVMCKTAELISAGRVVFSPIVHSHVMALQYNLPTDISYWNRYCITMLRCASKFLIYRLPGWDVSAGIALEHDIANRLYLPIEWID